MRGHVRVIRWLLLAFDIASSIWPRFSSICFWIRPQIFTKVLVSLIRKLMSLHKKIGAQVIVAWLEPQEILHNVFTITFGCVIKCSSRSLDRNVYYIRVSLIFVLIDQLSWFLCFIGLRYKCRRPINLISYMTRFSASTQILITQ